MNKLRALLIGLVLFSGRMAAAQGPSPQTIRVISLPGRSLPVVVAEMHGTFAKYGIQVQTESAPNSDVLRSALAAGRADIAHAAVDNAVAMVDSAAADVVIVMGGEDSLNELIADAKKNPGKFSYSTQGVNSFTHMFVRIFLEQAGIDLKMIPYPGTAEAIAAVLGGHLDVAVVGGTGGLYEAGRLDILAVSEKTRLSTFPKVPTLVELGYPIVFNAAYFVAAPKGTPNEVLDKLTAAHQKAFAKYGDEIGATLNKFEMLPAYSSAKELVDQNNYRRDLFRKAAKGMGILVPNR